MHDSLMHERHNFKSAIKVKHPLNKNTLKPVSTASRALHKCSKRARIQYDSICSQYVARTEIEIYGVLKYNEEHLRDRYLSWHGIFTYNSLLLGRRRLGSSCNLSSLTFA